MIHPYFFCVRGRTCLFICFENVWSEVQVECEELSDRDLGHRHEHSSASRVTHLSIILCCFALAPIAQFPNDPFSDRNNCVRVITSFVFAAPINPNARSDL